MATAVESAERFSAGMPVEVGRIDRELKKLWEQSGGAVTRASLINLAVYSEVPGSLGKNTALVSRLAESNACRAIVIGVNPEAKEPRVEAWISAHCHVSKAGAKQICSEQISFSIDGSSTALLTNVVFSHLDSDLPLYFWWQGEFHDPMDPQLFAWVDRLIYDSHDWKDFGAQMRRVEIAQEEAKQRVVLCDLNWTRIVHQRLALAQFFDCGDAPAQLSQISGVEIEYAPGFRSTAILLLGWFAAQVQWQVGSGGGNEIEFRAGEKSIRARLDETEGAPISRLVVRSGSTEFCVLHAADADLLDVTVFQEGSPQTHQLMPAGKNDSATLLSEELMRGGPHRVYLRAINCVRELL
jgi:glucose-6-phosphate dehydrogenase assembly protein OpcA